jgi:hypothetical protein
MNSSIRLRFQCNILLLPTEIVALFLIVAKINQCLSKTTWKLKSMIAKLTVEEADLIEAQLRNELKLKTNLLETLP